MKKGERRKRDLLQIAYGIFISRGYESTGVDEIIETAGIAKGTYYDCFHSKEQMPEEVIGMMLEAEAEKAEAVLQADLPVQQKIAGIIASIQPEQQERIRMILILSSDLFDGHTPCAPGRGDIHGIECIPETGNQTRA